MAVPTAAEVATYLGKAVDDANVINAYAAEVSDQTARCRVDPYNDSLGEALKRRVARNLAMKGIPLGVQIEEFGGTRIGSKDPEVTRLEAPYRRKPMG